MAKIRPSQHEFETVCGRMKSSTSHYWIFPCPVCRSQGADKTGNNLTYCHRSTSTTREGSLDCRAVQEHGVEILKMIWANRKNSNYEYKKESKPIEYKTKDWCICEPEKMYEALFECQELFKQNMDNCQEYMLKRGFTLQDCEEWDIGYDSDAKAVTIPLYSEFGLTDFELRYLNNTKPKARRVGLNLHHKEKSPCWLQFIPKVPTGEKQTCIGSNGEEIEVNVMEKSKNCTLYVIEGFLDGIALVTYLKAKGVKDFSVLSGWDGVGTTLTALEKIDLNEYKEVKLLLDRDIAGQKAIRKIRKQFPFCKRSNMFLGKGEDFGDFFFKYRNK